MPCDAITSDWPARAAKSAAASQAAQPLTVASQSMGAFSASKISVSSIPANADIEIDGSFVGNTPSAIDVTPGEHSVVVKKTGYKNWERKLKVTGGSVNVSAELESFLKELEDGQRAAPTCSFFEGWDFHGRLPLEIFSLTSKVTLV